MNIEISIHTLAIIPRLANLLQVIALFTQCRLDKAHSRPGWWALERIIKEVQR